MNCDFENKSNDGLSLDAKKEAMLLFRMARFGSISVDLSSTQDEKGSKGA